MLIYFTLSSVAYSIFSLLALQSHPRIRWLYLFPITALALISLWLSRGVTALPVYNAQASMTVILCYLHITNILYIEQYRLPTQATPQHQHLQWKADWKGAWKILYNAQRNDIVPAQDSKSITSKTDDNPSELPILPTTMRSYDRRVFLCKRTLSLLSIYAVMVLYHDLIDVPGYLAITAVDYLPHHVVFLRRLPLFASPNAVPITSREVCIRAFIVVDGIIDQRLTLIGLYYLLSLIFVGIGLDQPEDWPRLFGDLSSATTVRGFWSRSHHRLGYYALRAYARLIARHVLPPRAKRTVLHRYVDNIFVFVLSGALHVFHEWLYGACARRWTMWFFVVQPVAMVVEASVQWIARETGVCKLLGERSARAVGYCWVFAWLFWSLPRRIYPKVTCVRS